MFSRAPNLKQISQRKLWGVSLSLLSFLRSIKKNENVQNPLNSSCASYKHTNNAALHFYVTSTKIVAIKVDNSVVNLMVPCQKRVEKEVRPNGQKSSRVEDTAVQRTEKSRHRSGSRMPGKVHRRRQALGSSVPEAGPATYRW